MPCNIHQLLGIAYQRLKQGQQTGQDRQSGLDKVPEESVTVSHSPGEQTTEKNEKTKGEQLCQNAHHQYQDQWQQTTLIP